MTIIREYRGGVKWWVVTKSEQPTWRMSWDEDGIVQDLIQDTDETLNLAILPIDEDNPNIFEAETKEECLQKIAELNLYFEPEIDH